MLPDITIGQSFLLIELEIQATRWFIYSWTNRWRKKQSAVIDLQGGTKLPSPSKQNSSFFISGIAFQRIRQVNQIYRLKLVYYAKIGKEYCAFFGNLL